MPANDTLSVGSYTVSMMLTGSCLSIVACSFVVVSFCRSPVFRRHPDALILLRTVLDIVFSVVTFSTAVAHKNAETSWAGCDLSSFLIQASGLGAEVCYFLLGVDLYVGLTNPFADYKANMVKYYIVVLMLGAGSGATLLASGHNGVTAYGTCWVRRSGTHNLNAFMWYLFYIPVMVFFVTAAVANLYTWRALRSGLSETYLMRRQVLGNGLRYIFTYSSYWALVGLPYALMYFTDYTTSQRQGASHVLGDVLLAAFALLYSLRGVATLVVWFLTHDHVCARVLPGKCRQQQDSQLAPHLNEALKREIVFYTTRGICEGVRQALAPPTLARSGSARLPYEEVFVAKMERQISFPRLVQTGTACGTSYMAFESVETPGAPEVSLTTMSRGCNRANDKEALVAPRTASAATQARSARSASSLRNSGAFVTVRDFLPDLFARVRELAGISPEDYIRSCSEAKAAQLSGGSSGAFFFFTSDKRFIVKTITKGECHTLCRTLGHMLEHFRANPSSLIAKIFSCHSLRLYGRERYFMVMENVLRTDLVIHETYDLKGSWVNRSGAADGQRDTACCRNCLEQFEVRRNRGCPAWPGRKHQIKYTYKDNDLHYKILLKPSRALALTAQLQRDSEWLQRMGIMDYSLLVGVHRSRIPAPAPPARSPDQDCRHQFRTELGGMCADSVDGPCVYFIGIIDTLQAWDWWKRMERTVKVNLLMQAPDGISCMPPVAYASRFKARLLNALVEADASSDRFLTPVAHVDSASESEDN